MAIKVFDGGGGSGYTPPSQTNNSGKFLTTNGTTTSWSPTGMVLLGSAAASGNLVTFSAIDQSYRDLRVIGDSIRAGSAEVCQVRANGAAGSSYYPTSYQSQTTTWSNTTSTYGGYFMYYGSQNISVVLNVYNYTANLDSGTKMWDSKSAQKNTSSYLFTSYGVFHSDASAQSGIGPITSLGFYSSTTWSNGTFYLYGVK